MSKISMLDFGEYVENQRNALKNILTAKKAEIGSDNLSSLVNNVNQLENINQGSEIYNPDSYFIQLINSYKNDPELKENGGEYDYSAYFVLTNQFEETVIHQDEKYNRYYKFSDGTTNTTSQDFTHSWGDNEVLETLGDGTKCRIIKIYGKESNHSKNCSIQMCRATTDTSSINTNESSLLFALFNFPTCYFPMGSGKSWSTTTSYSKCIFANNLRYLYFGEKVSQPFYSSGSGSDDFHISCCKNLEYIKSENTVSFPSSKYGYLIGNCPKLKYFDMKFYGTIRTGTSAFSPFSYLNAQKLRYVNENMFYNMTDLDLSKISSLYYYLYNNNKTFSGFNFNTEQVNIIKGFSVSSTLTGLTSLTLPNFVNCSYNLLYSYNNPDLVYLSIPENYDASLNLSMCISLSRECIQGILNALKDKTDVAANTITFPYSLKNVITEELLEGFTAKNWTVSWNSSY